MADRLAGRLAGKTALITGASAGMGRATALRFAREGANVVLVGRSREQLDQAAAEIGEQALPVVADVRRAAELEAAFNAGLQRWGEIQIVFNNAGGVVFDSSDEDLARPYLVHELSEALFDEYIALNLKSAWLGMKYGIPASSRPAAARSSPPPRSARRLASPVPARTPPRRTAFTP